MRNIFFRFSYRRKKKNRRLFLFLKQKEWESWRFHTNFVRRDDATSTSVTSSISFDEKNKVQPMNNAVCWANRKNETNLTFLFSFDFIFRQKKQQKTSSESRATLERSSTFSHDEPTKAFALAESFFDPRSAVNFPMELRAPLCLSKTYRDSFYDTVSWEPRWKSAGRIFSVFLSRQVSYKFYWWIRTWRSVRCFGENFAGENSLDRTIRSSRVDSVGRQIFFVSTERSSRIRCFCFQNSQW